VGGERREVRGGKSEKSEEPSVEERFFVAEPGALFFVHKSVQKAVLGRAGRTKRAGARSRIRTLRDDMKVSTTE
jgi:hypothetical protein